jgi:hypothetical protein
MGVIAVNWMLPLFVPNRTCSARFDDLCNPYDISETHINSSFDWMAQLLTSIGILATRYR